MTTTDRLGLHKPASAGEKFGDYFPLVYATDLQTIDDEVQIKNLADAGELAVYDVDGHLVGAGIGPEDLEVGLIDSILTDWGMLLARGESALAAISPGTAGKSLLSAGAGAMPLYGYPAHSTLTGLTSSDPHTQYVLRSLLTARGAIPYRGASAWMELAKSITPGDVLMQGANDPYWGLPKLDDLGAPDDNTDLDASTSKHGLMSKFPNTKQALLGDNSWAARVFAVGYNFGSGAAVLTTDQKLTVRLPLACKITAGYIREVGRISGSITCTLYIHDIDADVGSAVDTFSISAASSGSKTGLSHAVAAGKYVTIVTSGISTVKQIDLSLTFEAT